MININGKTYVGKSIQISNGKVMSDDLSQGKKIEVNVTGEFNGNLLVAEGDVNVNGDIGGNVNAGGSVSCDDVRGNVDAGGSVTCDDVGHYVSAGGSVSCDDISGSVMAGGSVRHR
ncbi:hypothetical protein P4639_22200 [Priestia megaterium]|uniref:hypothetical protein n=1 Tax=Priestia megaterium TaxID=1404 RepID=UPI002E20E25C|nr:hypothetical protein [Priestia megaterium]